MEQKASYGMDPFLGKHPFAKLCRVACLARRLAEDPGLRSQLKLTVPEFDHSQVLPFRAFVFAVFGCLSTDHLRWDGFPETTILNHKARQLASPLHKAYAEKLWKGISDVWIWV